MGKTEGLYDRGGTETLINTLTGHRYHRLDAFCPLMKEHCRDDCALYVKHWGYCALRLISIYCDPAIRKEGLEG